MNGASSRGRSAAPNEEAAPSMGTARSGEVGRVGDGHLGRGSRRMLREPRCEELKGTTARVARWRGRPHGWRVGGDDRMGGELEGTTAWVARVGGDDRTSASLRALARASPNQRACSEEPVRAPGALARPHRRRELTLRAFSNRARDTRRSARARDANGAGQTFANRAPAAPFLHWGWFPKEAATMKDDLGSKTRRGRSQEEAAP